MFLSGLSCLTCHGHRLYDISATSSGKDLQSKATINFAQGTVDGDVVSDKVFVTGFEVSQGADEGVLTVLVTEAPYQ
jgi:hypothetical protein